MWTKLGFEVLQSGVNGLWPSSIEDLAVYFHLPSEHALKSKLIPKGIKSSIFSFDVAKDSKNLCDIHCPSHILSLQYYKDSWFDYSAIEQELSDLDTRKQCITWMRSNFDFQDIPANNSSIADMISYIFLNRLKLMIDTVTVSSAGDDLREISDEEGYMSEIAMDYCMMSMFFHVNKIKILSLLFLTLGIHIIRQLFEGGLMVKFIFCTMIHSTKVNVRSFQSPLLMSHMKVLLF